LHVILAQPINSWIARSSKTCASQVTHYNSWIAKYPAEGPAAAACKDAEAKVFFKMEYGARLQEMVFAADT